MCKQRVEIIPIPDNPVKVRTSRTPVSRAGMEATTKKIPRTGQLPRQSARLRDKPQQKAGEERRQRGTMIESD